MPNWCENKLVISGDQKAIEKLYKIALSADNEKGFFNQIVKRPKSQEENWYDWNTDNWGTNWDIQPDYFTVGKVKQENDIYSFQINLFTAWSPPSIFVKKMCSKFKVSAKLNYIEYGCFFMGLLTVESNKFVNNECSHISLANLIYFGYDQEYIDDAKSWLHLEG